MKLMLSLLAIALAPSFLFAQNCDTLHCHQGLTITLISPDEEDPCSFMLEAEDLIASDLTACVAPLSYAVYFEDEASQAGFEAEFTSSTAAVYLNMDHIPYQELRVYLRDGNGIVLETQTDIFIATSSVCFDEPPCNLFGTIITEINDPINNVTVHLGDDVETTTNENGVYSLISVDCSQAFTITPYKNTHPANGVSAFDLILMSQHILGIHQLDSPYKMLAADINRSGSITTIDMIWLRKLILNIEPNFPNNTSWRFVPADYEFPVALNPWVELVPEMQHIIPDSTNLSTQLDFIGIKVGDVNNSADASL